MKSIFKKIIVFKLTLLARLAIFRFKPKIIAVTGNVGKTSTKDAIYSVVKTAYNARKSEKSLNSDIGLPLAVLGLESAWNSPLGWFLNVWKGFLIVLGIGSTVGGKDFPELLVLEVGADHPGDIASVTKWLHPDIVVLTRMSDTPVHIEFFKDKQEVLAEKMHLARALKSGGENQKGVGVLIVNSDDQQFVGAVKEVDVKKIFFGKNVAVNGQNTDVRIIKSEIIYDSSPLSLPIGQQLTLQINSGQVEKIEFRGLIGDHLMYSIAGACAVAVAMGIESNISEAFRFIDGEQLPKGRMRLIPGREKSLIIDDTYNSSPLACGEALKTLNALAIRGRKIAVLGDMKELGEYTEKAHREIGRLAADVVHTLVVVGESAKLIADSARENGLSADRIFSYKDSWQAGAVLADMVRPGDVVLVKGSQSMRMERVSASILADGIEAGDVLVRQEKVWEAK